MAIELVTGYKGEAHVTAAQDGRRNAGVMGGRYVLPTGQEFAVTVDSANQVTVGTGDGILDGRHVTSETMTTLPVDSGTQGKSRHDLVCVRYQRNASTGVESASLVVVKGTPADYTPRPYDPGTDSATDPDVNDGDVLDGDSTVDWPLWRLTVLGIDAPTATRLFAVAPTMADVAGKAAASHAHAASDVTSGTLPVTRGGTGASTATNARRGLGIASGTGSATTDSNGVTTFNPGLGTRPSIVVVSPIHNAETEAIAKIMVPMVWSIDSANQVQVRWKRTDTNAWLTGNRVCWSWVAIA